MEHRIYQLILSYLQNHPHLGNFFIFIVAFSESLPIIGTIIPGSITMTVVGILIGTGALPMTSSLLIASIGAFAGDAVGFAAGYYYNEGLRNMWPFKKHAKWLTMGEAFFKKHGGKSIILGRFIGPARSTVPLVAGLLRLSWLRFCVAAIPSAMFWAVMYMVPGILLGAISRELPKAETTKFILYGLAVLLVLWFIYWVIQHFFIQLTRGINFITDKSWQFLSRKKAGRFFIRFVTNQQNPADHHQLTLLLTALISGILFLILLVDVRNHGLFIAANYPVFHLLQTIRTPQFNKIFSVITIMGMPKTILLISAIMTAGLVFKKQYRSAAHFLMAFVLTAGAVIVFKHLSHSLRPQGFELVSTSSSFPSGHTTLSFVIFSFIAFFAAQIITNGYRWIAYTISTIMIALIAFSRLYLGAHWLADIIGSSLLGLTVLLVCIIDYRRMPKKTGAFSLSPISATLLLLITLGISWGITVPLYFQKTLSDTTPIWSTQGATIEAWWNSPLQFAPLYRNNRFGKPFQPFNVQWQGSLAKLRAALKKSGWKTIPNEPKLELKATLQRFVSHKAEYHTSLLTWLYHDKPPVLFLIKSINNQKQIIELRIWESEVHFHPGNKPLWIGATDILTPPKKLLSLHGQSKISLSNDGGLRSLAKDTRVFQQKMVRVPIDPNLPDIVKLNWNGKILLIRE